MLVCRAPTWAELLLVRLRLYRVEAREKVTAVAIDATQRFEALVNGTPPPESALRASQNGLVYLAGLKVLKVLTRGGYKGLYSKFVENIG